MKKLLLAGLFLFAFPSFAMAQVAQSTTNADVDTVEQSSCMNISNNLRYRTRDASVNNEVSDLQDFLNMNGYLKSGPTGYFGLATLNAVKRFQKASGFVPTGYVGPLTRAKINAISCEGAGVTPVATPTTSVPTQTTSPMPTTSPSVPVYTPTTTTVVSKPTLIITSPNGGETFSASDSISVKYSVSNLPASTELTAYLYNPINGNIASNLTVGPVSGNGVDSIYLALSKVANIPTGQYKITLCALSVSSPTVSFKPLCDMSDNYFTINAANTQSAVPSITVLSPNGGEQIQEGATQTIIKWSTKNFSGLNVSIDLVDSTGYVTNIASNISNTGYYYWNTAAGVKGGYLGGYSYKIRISSNDKGPSAVDDSDSYFSIATATTETITTAVPTVEFIGTPTLSLQYDSAGKESVLVGNIAFKITAGTSDVMFSGDTNYPTVPYVMAFNGCCRGVWAINGPTSINAGATATYTGTLTSPTKVMFAGTYNLLPSTLGYSVNGVWQNLDSSSFKNARPSNSVTIVGETAPYITSANQSSSGGLPLDEIMVIGVRFSKTFNYVAVNGITKTLPLSAADVELIKFKLSDFNIVASGWYTLQVLASEGSSNIMNVNVTVPTTTTTTTSTACPQSIIINGTTYTLSPCSIDMSMIDGQGNKNFTTTLVPTGGSSANFGYSVRGYGVGFPTYGILGASSGGAIGNTPLTFYFNDNYLSADGSNPKIYSGHLPIHIFQGSEGNDNNFLNLNVNLTVNPAVTTATMAPSSQPSQLASLIGAFSPSSVQTLTPTPASTWAYAWTRDLQIGSSYADDITALQTALTKEGVYTGEVTGGFYSQTYLGVKAFQAKYGIESTGFVGQQTLAKLNELY